jgi:prolyl oligopeptidase
MQVKRIAPGLALLVVTAFSSGFPSAQSAQQRKPYPKTKVDKVTETLHGVTIVDPYRWLEDQNSPETRVWISEQNRYTQAVLGEIPGRDRLRKRLTDLLKTDVVGTPRARGGRYFFAKRLAAQNQAVVYVRENGKDRVLIDPNKMSADQTTSVAVMDISLDGKLLVYGVREGGEDELTPRVMEVDSGRDLPDLLLKARYFTVSLKPDNTGLYYSRFGEAGPRVLYHKIGSDVRSDPEVFGKQFGPAYIVSALVSHDGRYLTLFASHGASGDRVDVYFQDIAKQGPIVPLAQELGAGFSGHVAGDRMYLLTNWQAPNWRILEVDLKNPSRERWKTVVPETGSVISDFALAGGKIVAHYLENVGSRLKIFDVAGKYLRDIPLPGKGTIDLVRGLWDSNEAFFSYYSFATPPTVYRYDIATGDHAVWASSNVPINSEQIEVKQVWYESKDKTKVPMYLVHKKGIKIDGDRPTLLTGYGGFNLSLTPAFSARAVAWVENGGIFAQPNMRGGGEFGENWHRAGMLEKKQNVFDDFISAAEWLIKNGYTNPKKLAISGGSNGGLLVGAAMNQRPELFQAVVCAYPLLDMIRYHHFLVARFWVPEYGSAEDPKQFEYLFRYSPYHNVRSGLNYPAVLFITGDSDTRVAPLHARKMAALLQATTGSERPVLLHYDTKAGHSAGLPVSKVIEDLTDELSFLFWQLGVTVE